MHCKLGFNYPLHKYYKRLMENFSYSGDMLNFALPKIRFPDQMQSREAWLAHLLVVCFAEQLWNCMLLPFITIDATAWWCPGSGFSMVCCGLPHMHLVGLQDWAVTKLSLVWVHKRSSWYEREKRELVSLGSAIINAVVLSTTSLPAVSQAVCATDSVNL